jgi:3-methyladenine DNA glycosylase Tag
MQIPPREVPADDNGYFEVLTKVIFQSGFRWSVVDNKWPGFIEAFAGFDIGKVAAFGPPEIEALMSDERIVRNGRKIEATVENADTLARFIDEHGSVKQWLASTSHLPWPERRKAIAAPIKNLGQFGVFHFMWCVGEAVPPYEERDTWTDPLPEGAPESLAGG